MLKHPILMNRSIIFSPNGVKLCRPSEYVLNLLDQWRKDPYYKEEGAVVIDEHENRAL